MVTTTNETLNAILEGLKPKREDNILSIGGSGDQALALLLKRPKISIVDKNPIQLDIIRRRINHIKKGNINSFMSTFHDTYQINLNYFGVRGRLNKIRDNIENISILKTQDFFDLKFEPEKFNKFYLSNATGWSSFYTPLFYKKIEKFYSFVNEGSLIYIADGENSWLYEKVGFKIQPFLTRDVRKKEVSKDYNWKPAVLYKPFEQGL